MRLEISVVAGFIVIASAIPPFAPPITITTTVFATKCVVWGPLPPQVTYTTSYTYQPPATVTTIFTNNPIQRVTVTDCPRHLKRSDAFTVTSTIYTNSPTQTVSEKYPSITPPPMEVVSVHPGQTEPETLASIPNTADTLPFNSKIRKRPNTVVNETQSLSDSIFMTNDNTKTIFPYSTATSNATASTNINMTLPFDFAKLFPSHTDSTSNKLEPRRGSDRVVWANSDCVPCLDWAECHQCGGMCSNCVNLWCRDPFGGWPICVSLERAAYDQNYNSTFRDFVGFRDDQ